MKTSRLAPLVLALALPLSACTVSVTTPAQPGAEPATPAQPAAPAAPAQPVTPASTTSSSKDAAPANAVWTHTLVSDATRPATEVSTRINGEDGVFAHSMQVWVGCDGSADTITLHLDGKYEKLKGVLGFRPGTPSGIVSHTLISVDGKPVKNTQLDADDLEDAVPVQLSVKGARVVTFETVLKKGQCGSATESYAVLGDGRVE